MSVAIPQKVIDSHGRLADRDLIEIAADVRVAYAELRQAAEMYADHQRHRIATENAIRSMTVNVADGYLDYATELKDQEERLSKELVRLYRQVAPAGVIAWRKTAKGVGEHMLARLLGQCGHPRLATPQHWARNLTITDDEFGDAENPKRMLVDGEPFLRTLAQFRQYCGHGQAGRRTTGMSQQEAFALGRPACKMLVHLIAEGVVKAQVRKDADDVRFPLGPLGAVYLDTKARYAERTHTVPCPGGFTSAGSRVVRARCKHDGQYAEAGDPFSPAHIHAIAMRHLGKAILAELFDAANEPWCD